MNAFVAPADLAQVSLDDKYALQSGRVFLTGTQALVRLPMMQRERDLAAGLNTAGFISGWLKNAPLTVTVFAVACEFTTKPSCKTFLQPSSKFLGAETATAVFAIGLV